MRFIILALIGVFAQSALVAYGQTDDMSRLRWGTSVEPGLQAGIAGPSTVGFKPRMAETAKSSPRSFNPDDVFTVAVRNTGPSPITLCAPPAVRIDAFNNQGAQMHTLGTGGLILGGAFGYKEVIAPGGTWRPPGGASVLYVTEHAPVSGQYTVRAHLDLDICAADRSHRQEVQIESDVLTVSLQ